MAGETGRVILDELKSHAPFTAFGALTGIAVMLLVVFAKFHGRISVGIFDVLHPLHVFLSALVTAAMFRRHKGRILWAFVLGYLGSVGTGTISDVIFPYLGGLVVGAPISFHLPFIEDWWLVNPAALLGIALAIAWPHTKVPHSAHVLISTWASLFYLVAYGNVSNWFALIPAIFVVLFVSVWLPCCFSDIVFPLLFISKGAALKAAREHTHGE